MEGRQGLGENTKNTVGFMPCGSDGLLALCLVAQMVKNPLAMQETWVRSLGWKDPLEKGKAYPLQYSSLEKSMDCIVHGIAKRHD